MPEIVIQPDGSLLVPRGHSDENQFFISLLEDLTDEESRDSLLSFFEVSEQSEVIFGTPGLCG
jgi:hypothetical protein